MGCNRGFKRILQPILVEYGVFILKVPYIYNILYILKV
ncbi:hypothetical protein CLV98_103359 [Dyadobacter jejuensis]|uniref:Uncharacterized protein n=1 Tax=Dyadobacter jejuensis TaxID=1082580 RepID=A0A316AN56_9BACT|nr:hypothetical protein CLV98_103359 [Dyadobacter jejuensis]